MAARPAGAAGGAEAGYGRRRRARPLRAQAGLRARPRGAVPEAALALPLTSGPEAEPLRNSILPQFRQGAEGQNRHGQLINSSWSI